MKADRKKTKNDKSRPPTRQEREIRNLVEKTGPPPKAATLASPLTGKA
jgi:hypothetical protein